MLYIVSLRLIDGSKKAGEKEEHYDGNRLEVFRKGKKDCGKEEIVIDYFFRILTPDFHYRIRKNSSREPVFSLAR